MNKLTADVDQNLTQFPSEGVKIRDLHHRSSLTRNVLQLFFVDPSANTNRNDVDTFVLNEKKGCWLLKLTTQHLPILKNKMSTNVTRAYIHQPSLMT